MSTAPVADYRGQILFRCSKCALPLTSDDFFALGLRLPDNDEARDDYYESELLDSVTHSDCAAARAAS